MPVGRIQIKRGLEEDFDPSTMLQGELYYTTDTKRLFITHGDGTYKEVTLTTPA